MSRGFLMFAHNNPQVDYGLMALCNALMIKANSQEKKVALVTDAGTLGWLRQSQGADLIARAFDHIIEIETPEGKQMRRYHDTQYTTHDLPWNNHSRASAYTLTPFEETILLDTDYLICDNTIDQVWGSRQSVRMNKAAQTLLHLPVHEAERHVEPFGVSMYWATCVYFRKDDAAKQLFDLVDVIRDNYDYYQFLYRFPGKLYRNDYAFSVAIHILSGWLEDVMEPLPVPVILTSFDTDELLDVPARNELVFLVQDPSETWKYRGTRTNRLSVHVMNKFSIIRNASKIISLYGGQDA